MNEELRQLLAMGIPVRGINPSLNPNSPTYPPPGLQHQPVPVERVPPTVRAAVQEWPGMHKKYPSRHFLATTMSAHIHALLQHLTPVSDEVDAHRLVLAHLRGVIQTVFTAPAPAQPGAQPSTMEDDVILHQFGSTASGMWLRGAGDMDLCIELSERKMRQMEVERERVWTEIQHEHQLALQEWERKQSTTTTTATTKEEEEDDDDDGEERAPRLRPKPSIAEIVLEKLGNALQQPPFSTRYTDIKILTRTRVPIIKLIDATTSLAIDIGFHNLLAVHNTRLLLAYSHLDPRVKQLCMLVKYWAKRRAVNDTYDGTLSSYAWVVMVIHYLQYGVKPAVVPNLQKIFTGDARDGPQRRMVRVPNPNYDPDAIDTVTDSSPSCLDPAIPKEPPFLEYDTYFFANTQYLLSSYTWPHQMLQSLGNTLSIGELLAGFFNYWAYEFDFKQHVASIREGGLLAKEDKGWVPLLDAAKKKEAENEGTGPAVPEDELEKKMAHVKVSESPEPTPTDASATTPKQPPQQPQAKKRERLQRFWVCIEDPFETTHNLGRPVGRDSLYFIRGEFLRAAGILSNARNYSRDYAQALSQYEYFLQQLQHQYGHGHPALDPRQNPHLQSHLERLALLAPSTILDEIMQETEYKTREEHKARNKENMEWSDRQRQRRKELETPTETPSGTGSGAGTPVKVAGNLKNHVRTPKLPSGTSEGSMMTDVSGPGMTIRETGTPTKKPGKTPRRNSASHGNGGGVKQQTPKGKQGK